MSAASLLKMVLRWLALVLATGAAGADEAFPSVHALIGRVAGSEAALHFTLEEVPADTKGREQMSLRSDGQRVVVGGTSPVAAASAFNWYLNDFLNTTYDWSTYQVILPQGSLPLPASRLTRPRLVKWSYHLLLAVSFGNVFALLFAGKPSESSTNLFMFAMLLQERVHVWLQSGFRGLGVLAETHRLDGDAGHQPSPGLPRPGEGSSTGLRSLQHHVPGAPAFHLRAGLLAVVPHGQHASLGRPDFAGVDRR